MAGKIIQPYIKHDVNASQDGKILRLYLDFRKLAKTMEREELESFVSHGAYAIFWRILEFMYSDKLSVDDVEVLADNLRIDSKFLSIILNDYNLFHADDGEYISDRLIKDLERQDEKSKRASESASIRYLMSDFKKSYVEFFGEEPVLQSSEIEALRKYNEKISDLKTKLPDIIYTLKNLKFDTDIDFKPCANWLLKDNNLARLLNGEFGKLKHKKTKKELKEEQEKLAVEREKLNELSELEAEAEAITEKSQAINYIKKYYDGRKIPRMKGRLAVLPCFRELMKKFNISDNEV